MQVSLKSLLFSGIALFSAGWNTGNFIVPCIVSVLYDMRTVMYMYYIIDKEIGMEVHLFLTASMSFICTGSAGFPVPTSARPGCGTVQSHIQYMY